MGETEKVPLTIRATVQDIVAPDVRELKARMGALDARMGLLAG